MFLTNDYTCIDTVARLYHNTFVYDLVLLKDGEKSIYHAGYFSAAEANAKIGETISLLQ